MPFALQEWYEGDNCEVASSVQAFSATVTFAGSIDTWTASDHAAFEADFKTAIAGELVGVEPWQVGQPSPLSLKLC
jgi:hypothetical protein